MRLVVFSDTHTFHDKLEVPNGDILICAGDFTNSVKIHRSINKKAAIKYGALQSAIDEIKLFMDWWGKQPHENKIFIAGNHEHLFETNTAIVESLISDGYYLCDESIIIGGIKFYGSPWVTPFHNWAWNTPRGESIRQKWAAIPDDTDVLITHNPPQGILDQIPKNHYSLGITGINLGQVSDRWKEEAGLVGTEFDNVGCADLMKAVYKIKPKYHIFGDIHECRGVVFSRGTYFINATSVNENLIKSYDPVVIDYESGPIIA